jgi:hypothetical protein
LSQAKQGSESGFVLVLLLISKLDLLTIDVDLLKHILAPSMLLFLGLEALN